MKTWIIKRIIYKSILITPVICICMHFMCTICTCTSHFVNTQHSYLSTSNLHQLKGRYYWYQCLSNVQDLFTGGVCSNLSFLHLFFNKNNGIWCNTSRFSAIYKVYHVKKTNVFVLYNELKKTCWEVWNDRDYKAW